jgi:hypothetical protein
MAEAARAAAVLPEERMVAEQVVAVIMAPAARVRQV